MPEISARDLKRLQGLDERFRRAQEENRTLSREMQAARVRADEAQRSTRASEEQLNDLLTENRRLAGELDALEGDADRAAVQAKESRRLAEKLERELTEARRTLETAQANLERLRQESDQIREHLTVAEAQLAERKVDPIVPPSRLAELVDDFVQRLGQGLSGVQVSEGELRLRAGVAVVDDHPGFVLPSPVSTELTLNALQEINLKFSRLDPGRPG